MVKIVPVLGGIGGVLNTLWPLVACRILSSAAAPWQVMPLSDGRRRYAAYASSIPHRCAAAPGQLW